MSSSLSAVYILIALCSLTISEAGKYPKTACGSGPSHPLILGNRIYGDRMLYTGHERMESSLFQTKSRDFKWPFTGQQIHEVITRVEALDKMTDGSGGCAFLRSGGVGSRNLTLHLKTQRGGEYDFLINIFGRY